VRRAGADPVVAALAARTGASPAELVLAWLRSLSPAIVPLPGATQVTTAVSAARAAALILDDDACLRRPASDVLPPGWAQDVGVPRRDC
jgi:aryl-alcohol dehydrogenase-like predicted oxidoreductase